MTEKKYMPSYTAEFRDRGVRLYQEHRAAYASDNAAYLAIAPKLGCSPDTLLAWCLKVARDTGQRAGPSSNELARLKEPEREVRELRQVNETLRKASAYFAPPLGDASIACRATGQSLSYVNHGS